MPPLRYQVFLSYGVAFLATWLYCLINKDTIIASAATATANHTNTPALQQILDIIITFAPIFAIVLLGIYLLSRLILGVLSFEDCPDAAKEIDTQIAEAKTEMKRRKVI
jgi:Dolichol-phosphate mannosyltransferase subunit 3 (DPM3)